MYTASAISYIISGRSVTGSSSLSTWQHEQSRQQREYILSYYCKYLWDCTT